MLKCDIMKIIRFIYAAWLHELNQLKTQPGTYIFLSFSWMALVLCAFFLGDFFASNRANMQIYFAYLPWVMMIILPALAMGTWSEEWRRGTAERLLTLPISPVLLTLGKFLAQFTVLLVLLIGTLPFVVTLYWLGNPAFLLIISGYIGAVLLGGTLLAVAMAFSQLSRHPAGGYVLGVLGIFILLALGWGVLNKVLLGVVPQPVLEVLIHYSVLEHFRRFNVGMVRLADVLFFISLTITFLWISHLFLLGQLRGRRMLRWLALPLVVLPIFFGLVLPQVPPTIQWDATANKVHTWHDTSTRFIQNLDEDIYLTFYFSEDHPDVPVPHKQFARQVMAKLRDMSRLNPERIKVERVIPEKDVAYEVQATKDEVQEWPLAGGEGYYFGLSLKRFDANGLVRQLKIPIFQPARAQFLEFDLMSALVDLMRDKPKKIGILTELTLTNRDSRPRFLNDLLDVYEIDLLRGGEPKFPDELDVAIIFMTPFFDDESLYALDQYIVQGGNVLLVMDPFLRTAPQDDLKRPDRNADDWAKDHPADLLRKWGIIYDYREIVADISLGQTVSLPGAGLAQYPLWLNLRQNQINQNVPFTGFVSSLLLAESGHFTQENIAEGLTYTPLLQTTANSRYVARQDLDTKPAQMLGSALLGTLQQRDLGALLAGTFQSTYTDMPAAVKQYYRDYADDPEDVTYPQHTKTSGATGRILLLGDLDFLHDEFALYQENRLGEQRLGLANDNLTFFYNAVQYLAGDQVLLPIRGKAVDQRPFTRIENLLERVAAKYQALEQELVAELFEVSQRLRKLQGDQKAEQALQSSVQEEVAAFKAREIDIKRKLRDVRRNLRQDVETLQRQIIAVNLLVAPLLLAAGGLMLWRLRRRRARPLKK